MYIPKDKNMSVKCFNKVGKSQGKNSKYANRQLSQMFEGSQAPTGGGFLKKQQAHNTAAT